MLPIQQTALFLLHLTFHPFFNIPCSLFVIHYSVDSPDVIGKPCSSRQRRDALPDKLGPTFVIEDRLELSTSVSETNMLPLHHSIIFAVRTGIEPVTTDRQSVMLAITPTNHIAEH